MPIHCDSSGRTNCSGKEGEHGSPSPTANHKTSWTGLLTRFCALWRLISDLSVRWWSIKIALVAFVDRSDLQVIHSFCNQDDESSVGWYCLQHCIKYPLWLEEFAYLSLRYCKETTKLDRFAQSFLNTVEHDSFESNIRVVISRLEGRCPGKLLRYAM